MAHDHNHVHTANSRRLILAIALTGSFMVAEVVGGILTQSLALLSDAAHMLTDVMALVIALMAIRIGARPADARRTFGYRRLEILAAALNAAVLFLVAFYILFEAWQRFSTPPEVASLGMLAIAVLGLLVNLAAMFVLRERGESLNMHAAYMEVFADMLGSVGVIAAALIIHFTGFWQADPIVAVLIGLWVLPRGWRLLKASVNILLEGVPEGIELQALHRELAALDGVREVHDVHVWAVTSGVNSLTAHLVAAQGGDGLLRAARAVAARHGIHHTNFQVESDPCHAHGACALADTHGATHKH